MALDKDDTDNGTYVSNNKVMIVIMVVDLSENGQTIGYGECKSASIDMER